MPKVGPKGQVVITKSLRDKLGIGPGWTAIERVVDDHLEMTFIPPEHNRSLKGILSAYATRTVSEAEWPEVREAAWEAAARERWSRMQDDK